MADVASALEISRSSDLLQVKKDVANSKTLNQDGALDPKGVSKIYTPTNGGNQELTISKF